MKKWMILFLALCLVLWGCSAPVEAQTRTIFAMDTVMELTVYADNEKLLSEAVSRIRELESKLSVTMDGSEIHTVNSAGTAPLSGDTADLLTRALALCASTGGTLDISIYPVVSAWGFTTGEYRIPEKAELETLLGRVNYSAIVLEEGVVSVPEGMQIDLGSVAKGYTGDIISTLLKENGVTSALLNLGGNVQAVGNKPDGMPWRVAVQHPTEDGYLGVLSISDEAAITSGGYERYFTGDDGQTYWHIIDPATGAPVDSGLISVTIVGDSGLICDGLSTALFVMGLEKAAQYWRNAAEEFEAILVTDDGTIYITEGLQGKFTLSENCEDAVLAVITR
ncbi:MAG: FAD:protein FMN transferase [Oscillospiraceae bacterium]|nr:FAD:protein FMN transferase [Oscillospiraceae bacterium]